MKIVGAMRIHAHEECCELAIDQLAGHVDAMFFLLHNVTSPRILRAINHPKTKGTFVYKGNYGEEQMLDPMFAMFEHDAPDWVLYPDSDESLPAAMPAILDLATAADRVAISFPSLIAWDSPYHVIPGQSPWGSHCRAVRWRPNIRFSWEGGFCYPKGDFVDRSLESPWPLIHYCYVTPAAREQKRGCDPGKGSIHPFAEFDHKSTPFHPLWTWDMWKLHPEWRDYVEECSP